MRQRPQVYVFIGQQAASRPSSPGHEAGAGRHLAAEVQFGIAATVETNSGLHEPVQQVEANQLPFIHAAADNELVPLRGVAGILDLVLVLIGPESMDVPIGGSRAEHRPRRRGALFFGVVEMLDADPPEKRVTMVRDVASRVDVNRAGPAQLVGKNPVCPRDR